MKKSKGFVFLLLFIIIAFIFSACQSYQRKAMPVKMPSAYPNAIKVADATLAAKIYDDKNEAESFYGFDIVSAGVVPVQIVFDNRGTHSIELVPSQTFLVDVENNIWFILDSNLAHERIAKKMEFTRIAPEATKGGILAGIAGAMIGAAIGIVSGSNVGNAALKGAALGAATGAAAGGVKGYLDKDTQDKIREDIKTWALANKAVQPGQLAYGFLFFPGEMGKAKELRTMLKETDTGKSHSFTIGF